MWSLAFRAETPSFVTTRQRCEICGARRVGTLERINGRAVGEMKFEVIAPRLEPPTEE